MTMYCQEVVDAAVFVDPSHATARCDALRSELGNSALVEIHFFEGIYLISAKGHGWIHKSDMYERDPGEAGPTSNAWGSIVGGTENYAIGPKVSWTPEGGFKYEDSQTEAKPTTTSRRIP